MFRRSRFRGCLPVSASVLLVALFYGAGTRTGAVAEAEKHFDFPDPGIAFAADFPGARLSGCTQASEAEYQVVIRPETSPINNSPWYAFQVRSTERRAITVRLAYEGGSHRYWPKISRDGKAWTRLASSAYRFDREKKQAVLQLEVGPEPLWVAAQEMITADDFLAWTDRVAALSFVEKGVLGTSVAGRPIVRLRIGRADATDHMMVIGRQHPPEITGSLALMAFVDTVVADTDLARRFRNRVGLTVVPLVNPDGVEAGNWRCNLGKLDLNRDWVKFSQPETRAVRDEFQRLAAEGKRPRLWLDFHSTGGDVFYTQADDQKTDPADFTKNWLGVLSARLPDYKVRRVSSHGGTSSTSTNWAHRALGIPAITYEVGDNTDREQISKVAQAAAEEMMRLLLSDTARSARVSDPAEGVKPRLVILTDIGGDPDDQQSMIRLMLYANEFEIEGLIASASGTPGELKQDVVKPELIRQIVAAYGKVRQNLAVHAAGYPQVEHLLDRVKAGNPKRGVENLGEGRDTEGSRWEIHVILEVTDDGEPPLTSFRRCVISVR